MFKNESGSGADNRLDDAGIPMANREEADINPDLIRREGFASEAEYRAYLATLGREIPFDAYVVETVEISEGHALEGRLRELREELETLQARLHVIRRQAVTVLSENARWADASAHAQLGHRPWLKLAGAMAAAFVVTRGLRRLPLGTVVTTALPLAAAVINRKLARD
ncbi:hypothetical protein ABID08_004017 [Rhizobium binae]|uniref:DUF2335 domain-containing protein n=1 Tax=Rhizobium binae TaxID=1138190 RepID=A0ABV2MJM6_9HYPH|nr:hypothetical protein [Rhizobium binae]MBX4994196.1 hypothetical protein [Rhizobium binae]NKL51422.1 hypothetical protein [Rhizobium leguminosarum bv. viciae]QSY84709.1 hypothetical protein J2J99_24305 [Rhizobium binae]